MKTLLSASLLIAMVSSLADAATPIAKCVSDDSAVLLTVSKRASGDWRSVDVTWERAGVTYTREFINGEIKQNDADRIRARQNHGFLGLFGDKTRFELDKSARTAVLSGVNRSPIRVGDGPHAPAEPKGKYEIKLTCEIAH
ncbi:MAG: hypothetical protein JST04_00560 [Bdellovibrionales bacterium]|nr:hypothetical protein [Bdellovibrionales bacterium]